MYRRNIYYYILNFQMKQNICRQCLRPQNFSSSPNTSLPVGDNYQSIRNQQIQLINTEQSKKRQLLNLKIEEWRKSKPRISLAKIVKLQVIRREELLLRKILSLILRDSPRCYRRLSLREMYEKPRKASRKIRIFYDSAGTLVAFYNSKNFKLETLSQIQDISEKVSVIGKSIIWNSPKPRIKLYISKWRKRIPILRSYFTRRIKVLRNRQKLNNIVSSLYNKNESIKKSLMVMNKDKINLQSRNILNFSIKLHKYPFTRPDRKQLESLLAFYFTKFQECIPVLTNYFSKFSQNGWRGENTKNMARSKDMRYENEKAISRHEEDIATKSDDYFGRVSTKSWNIREASREVGYKQDIFVNENEPLIRYQKPFDKPEKAIFKASGYELKPQPSVQRKDLEKSLNDINVHQSTSKNDIETLEKLLSVQKELVNLNSSLEGREVSHNFEHHNGSDIERTISEIEKYDSILREMNLNKQMNQEKFWEEHGKALNDQIDVPISSGKSELGNFPDDIINSYKKFKGNYLSLDLIDNALMITAPVDPENVQSLKNKNVFNETQPNNIKFEDTREDSYKETSTKNKLPGEIKENFDLSIISNQIAMPKELKTGREMKTYDADFSLKEVAKTSNAIDAPLPLDERSSLKSKIGSKNIRDRMDHRKYFELDTKLTSSYLRINENKQFSEFNSNLFRKKEKPTKDEKGLQRIVGGNKINCSESHRIGDYPELKNAVRDSNKRFSVSKILGCDRPPNLNREISSHTNALKNNNFPKKKTRAELEKQPKSIKYMQNLLLSNNERSKYHTQSDLVIKEIDSVENIFKKSLSGKEVTLNGFEVSTAPRLKKNEDENIFSESLKTNNLKREYTNKKKENTNIEALNEMKGYEQKLFKDMVEHHNNPFLEIFSGFQKKIDNLQNKNKIADSKSLQLNSMSNQNTSLISVIDETPIKTPDKVFNSELLYNKNVSNDSIGMEEKAVLKNVSRNRNSESVARNEPNGTKYYKNEFDLKCRFDFPPELESDSIKVGKTIAENIKPMGMNQNIKPNRNESDREILHHLPYLREYPIQNKEIPSEIIEQKNIYQSPIYNNDEIEKKNCFESESKLELYSHKTEKIAAEPKNMEQHCTMSHKNDLDENRFVLPDMGANSLKTKNILTENTRLQNMNKTEKYYRNEFDFKCRFDFPPDLEIKPLKKEIQPAQTENDKNVKTSRKFSDLVLKLEQMKINNTNWFTHPIELSNDNSSFNELHPKLNNLNKQLAGGDNLQNENVQKQVDIRNKIQNNNSIEKANVSKEIVLPSTMKHYFDHEYSKIMDNFKLPDLKKYSSNVPEHENSSEYKEKIVNKLKELQEEKIKFDNHHQDKISFNSRMQILFNRGPINNDSRFQITKKENKNINVGVPFNENLKSDLNIDGKMKPVERYSHKLNIDVFADNMNNKIAESVILIQDISKSVQECQGQKVEVIHSSRSISNQTVPTITSNHLNNATESINNSDIDHFEGENELSDSTAINSKVVQSKPYDVPTIQEDEQDDLLDKNLNPSEMSHKPPAWEREMTFDEKIDLVRVENHGEPLITDVVKKPSMKNTWFLTAANNLENDNTRTGIHCDRFEEKPIGVEDKVYGKVFKKLESIETTNDLSPRENEQTNDLREDNYYKKTFPQQINTMTFVKSDIISNGEHYETLEEDCKSIVGEMRGLYIEEENNEYPINNESNDYGQVINNTNINNANHAKEFKDTTFTRNVRSNTMLNLKVDKRFDYGVKGLDENLNEYGYPQLKNTVSNGRFSEIMSDNVDDYDYIYSNIFVNSKFDNGQNLPRELDVYRKSSTRVYRTSRKQGQATVKFDKHKNKRNSNIQNLGRNIESISESTTIVDQEIHRNLELAKLDRLHKVLNDLEKVVGSLTEKVENRRDFFEGGKSNFDFKEQKMMLCDINDSIISSLASLHIFKGNYNKLKLEKQFNQLRQLEDNSMFGEDGSSFDSKQENKVFNFEKSRSTGIKEERHSKNRGTSKFEYQDGMQENGTKVFNISSSGSSSNLSSKMNESGTTRSKKIVDRFYKYRHRTFLTHLSKIPEEESVVDSESSQMEMRKDNLLENASTKNSLDALHSSTTFAASLRPHLNPEYLRKILKQLCTRCVVDEMLQKTEEASSRNKNVLQR